MQVDVQTRRLKIYREELKKTQKALAELNKEETSTGTVSGSEDSDSSDGGEDIGKEVPTELEQFLSNLDKQIKDYNFEQELSEISTTWQQEIEKLDREKANKLITAKQLGASEETLDKIKDFYGKQVIGVIKEAKDRSLEAERQYQNELALLQKEGLEKELEQLNRQEEAELEANKENIEAIDDIRELYEIKRQQVRERYAEKEEELRQEQIEKEKKNREELIEWKYENGFISIEYYRNYLQERLKEYEMFSEKWKEIYGELKALPEAEKQGANLLKEMTYNGPGGGPSGSEDEGVKSLNWMTDAFADLGIEIETANQKFTEWKDDLVDGLSEAIVQGKSLSDVFENIADQMAAMVIKQGIIQPIVDWGLGEIGLDTAHEGGYISPAGLIKNLPSYHNGGLPGLKPDETIIKAQTGERMLSREQNKAFENAIKSGATYNITINAVDSQSFAQAIQRNPEAVISVVSRDYSRNGVTRKIIKGGN
jgi:DNA repair exonuclease SbcCD ATPase subunit